MPVIQQDQFYAFTGGPGAGKTTLLQHLAAEGYAVAEEAARVVIREAGGRPEPMAFLEAVLARDIAAFGSASGLTLFDRSIVDVWGGFGVSGLTPSPAAEAAVASQRYNRRAFIAPPWREIYVNDAERDQTWDDAIASYQACAQAYADAGYDLIELPRTDVVRRAAFVREIVGRP